MAVARHVGQSQLLFRSLLPGRSKTVWGELRMTKLTKLPRVSLCRAGTNRRWRIRTARAEGIEQSARLDSAHFPFWRKTNCTSVTKSNEFSAGSHSWEE